jgi:hypothetical protein
MLPEQSAKVSRIASPTEYCITLSGVALKHHPALVIIVTLVLVLLRDRASVPIKGISCEFKSDER